MKCKMLHFSLCAAGALLLSASAFAQQDATAKVRPAPATAKDAGVYHVATGTWTRASKDPIATIGPDVLYDNTCSVGFWSALGSTEMFVDGARMPSTTSPTSLFTLTGTANAYPINGFQTSYCVISAPTLTLLFQWYECYASCSDVTLNVPIMSVPVSAPADPGLVGLCWVVTYDLTNTTFEFTMSADCNGTYGGNSDLDGFGWSIIEIAPSPGTTVGPMIAGDPLGIRFGGPNGTGCPIGDGTIWRPGIGAGTGIGADDAFESNLGGVYNACYFFGGYFGGSLFAAFWHEVWGDSGGSIPVGTSECFCDAANAPCGNASPTTGCLNSVGTGAEITGSGTDVIANANLVLSVTGARPLKSGVWLQGTATNQILFRDGNLCVAGLTVRLYPDVIDANGDNDTTDVPAGSIVAQSGSKGYVIGPGSLWYQMWYRDGGGPCGTQSNLTNALRVDWQ